MHFLQAINSNISVLIVCNKTGGTIKRRYKEILRLLSHDFNFIILFCFMLLCGSCVATIWTVCLGFDEIYQRLLSLKLQILKMPRIWQPWSYHMVCLRLARDFCIKNQYYIFLMLCLCILIVCLCIFIASAGTLRLPRLRFFRAFSLVVRQMPG